MRTAADDSAKWDTNRLPLGPQSAVRAELARVFGDGTWQGPDQGIFDGPGFSLLAKLGLDATVEAITLEVWGQGDPAPSIGDLCREHGWLAVVLDTWKPLPPVSSP